MAELPQFTPLPADLPTDWQNNQIISPNGTEVGLTQQHGYNYLNEAVNSAQTGVNTLQTAATQLNTTLESVQTEVENINTQLPDLAPSVMSYNITLSQSGWSPNSTGQAALTGMYLQQITVTTFTANQRVDISIPPSVMSTIPAGITTANVSGTVYAVTEYPPETDVDAQITVITLVAGGA